MKYILRKCFCNIELQNAAMIWGVLASVCSGLLLITALSTNVFMDRIYVYGDHNYGSYYYATTRLYWILVVGSTLHLITSIFLAIGAEKKNELMFVPWMIVQSLSAISLVPIVFVVVMVAVVVSFPIYIWWTVYSLFMKLKAEKMEITATAPPFHASHSNTFTDIHLPAYNDVVPESTSTKNY